MSKTTIQIVMAALMALLFSFGAQATEPEGPVEGEEPTPQQCIWFLQNCAPPVSSIAASNQADEFAAN